MKKSISVILACALILALGIGAWAVKPVPDGSTTTRVTGGGEYTVILDDAAYIYTLGHHCSFGFQAQGPAGGGDWSGRGSFTDEDYRLKAILTITDSVIFAEGPGPPEQIQLTGTATVYYNDARVDTEVEFQLNLIDGEVLDSHWPDRAGFRIWIPGIPIEYVSGGDLSGGQIKFH